MTHVFSLEEAYLGNERTTSGTESSESTVDWTLFGIYREYLWDHGLTLQSEGIEHLIEHELRPRSGTLTDVDLMGLSFWWYYRSNDHEYRAFNRIPTDLARCLTGKPMREDQTSAIIVYTSFTEAIQDFARAWERHQLARNHVRSRGAES